MTTIYCHETCTTCRNAIAWLDTNGIPYTLKSIRKTPPGKQALKQMLKAKNGELRKLFNTSGMDYRAMGMKEKLATMSEAEAFDLLASNGMLVKRPFVLGDGIALTGFKVAEWERAFGKPSK